MSRFGALDRLRERWLAAAGLVLASIALVLGLLPDGGEPQTTVLALRHALAAGRDRACGRCRGGADRGRRSHSLDARAVSMAWPGAAR